MVTLQEKLKQRKFEEKRKQLLLETIKDLLHEKIFRWYELAEELWTLPSVISNIKNDIHVKLDADKVEEWLSKLITE